MMKIIKSRIPTDSLVANYLPADYSETYETVVDKRSQLTPDNLLIAFWMDFPGWVQWLFRLRDILVRPFGLKDGDDDYHTSRHKLAEIIRTGGSYNIMNIPSKSKNETVMQLEDKHLTAELSCHVENANDSKLKISIITLVHYHNTLGKIYFAAIKPFHTIIVRKITKRSIGKLKQKAI
jgi:hypothetical protein